MRRFASVTVAAALVLLVAAPVRATPADDFAKLLADYDQAQLQLFPSNAIQRNDKRFLGLYEDNLTAAHLTEERRLNTQERARLAAIERNALSAQDRLSYDILGWTLTMRAEEIAAGQGEVGQGEARQMLPLDQFNGAQLSFAREVQWRSQYPLAAAEDYTRLISRMKGFAHWVDTAIARMRDGAANGIVLPRIIVARLIPEIEQFTGQAPEASLFMGPVKNLPASIKPPERARIAAALAQTVRDQVLPAYRRLRDFLKTEYLAKARASVGLSALANGRAMYLHDVRARTTMNLSPDAIHALGLRELGRIAVGMEAAKNEAGFSGTMEQFRAHLHSDPRFRFSNPAAMLADFERARRIAAAHVASLFGRLPKARLEIRFYEAFVAPVKSAAEYSPLSADGRRPGIIYVNGYNFSSRPNYTTDVLALHEGLPGHHLQIALAVENVSLPLFRRFGGPSAFTEGWAQYAETLGPALGLYTDALQKFGALAFDAWRSARLVVDTGIHWRGWSEEQALQFLLAHTVLSQTEAQGEIERYIAIPAQALAYKIGELKFLELKARAQALLGAKFDVRRFHDEVLRDGAMPLGILEAKMDRWLAAERAR